MTRSMRIVLCCFNTCLTICTGIWLTSSLVNAQNTTTPRPIQYHVTGFWDDSLFCLSFNQFVLGHQWGASDLDKVNTALRCNLTSDNFGYLDSSAYWNLQHLGGYTDTNYLSWATPLANQVGVARETFLENNYGMRWDPAEHTGLDRRWLPRDAGSWPFGFIGRYHGRTIDDPSDVNYRRYIAEHEDDVTYPVRILDSVEPSYALHQYGRVHWERRMPICMSTDDGRGDLRRLQLVVNLRRIDLDTARSDEKVLSIIVPYTLHWAAHDMRSFSSDRSTYLMPFVLVPHGGADSALQLPEGRGRELPLDVPQKFTDTIHITRKMLPRADDGDPDITIVAEFRTDSILNEDGTRREHILKATTDDYAKPEESDASLRNSGLYSIQRKRYHSIDTLGVTVLYHGTANVAIRSVSLLTPTTKNMVSGYRDSAWASAFVKHKEDIRKAFSYVNSMTGRHLKIVNFYMHDEFEIDQLIGMRYKLDFLDGRLTSEAGYSGRRYVQGRTETEYGLNKLHGFPTRYLFTSANTLPHTSTPAPYMARSGVNEFDYDNNQPIPAPVMGLKSGYKWTTDTSPYRKYETDIGTRVFGDYTALSLSPYALLNNGEIGLDSTYESVIDPKNSSVGMAMLREYTAYNNLVLTGNWYFEKRRMFWSYVPLHHNLKHAFDTAMRPFVFYTTYRPPTGEELRSTYGFNLMMGTKGFIYDKWHNKYQRPLAPAKFDSTYRNKIVNPNGYYPGYATPDSIAYRLDNDTNVTAQELFMSKSLGGDYYTTDDVINIDDWAQLAVLGREMDVRGSQKGDVAACVYVGRASLRNEAKWWHDLVTDTVTQSRGRVHASNAELFFKNRPVAWYGKGLYTNMQGDTAYMSTWLPGITYKTQVHRWTYSKSTVNSGSFLSREPEPYNEQLFDVMLMDTSESSTSVHSCIIAVSNRRTSPMLFNTSMRDSVEFMPTSEFNTMAASSDPSLRYKQVGARYITLPFQYTSDQTKPYLLQIRELRPSYDQAHAIDTVLLAYKKFEVPLRPGETRFFDIRCVPYNIPPDLPADILPIQPNPTTDVTAVYIPEDLQHESALMLHIFNVEGQLIRKDAVRKGQLIYVQDLSSGSYHVQLFDGSSVKARGAFVVLR